MTQTDWQPKARTILHELDLMPFDEFSVVCENYLILQLSNVH